MATFDSFIFVEPRIGMVEDNAFVFLVPAGLNDVYRVLKAFYEGLKFPGYFGFNWDALSDCLRDFHWISERIIVVRHQDLPDLRPNDLRNYLEVLDECARSWKPEENHQLLVTFPQGFQHRIKEL